MCTMYNFVPNTINKDEHDTYAITCYMNVTSKWEINIIYIWNMKRREDNEIHIDNFAASSPKK